jgi:flavin-binding protein dodecin
MSTYEGEGEPRSYPGSSRDGFSAAAADAVRKAEDEYGTIESRLVVVEMSVDVEGPIGDYRIVLGPGGP